MGRISCNSDTSCFKLWSGNSLIAIIKGAFEDSWFEKGEIHLVTQSEYEVLHNSEGLKIVVH